jgi:hypothetical protein
MQNRQIFLVSVILFGISLFSMISVIQAQISYSSGYQVQNLSAVQANISIQYYNKVDQLRLPAERLPIRFQPKVPKPIKPFIRILLSMVPW